MQKQPAKFLEENIYAPIPKALTPDRKSSGLMGDVSLSTQHSWKLSALIATARCMVPSADWK